MQKKVFLQRGSTSGGAQRPRYMKVLMWAAVGLIVLVLVTPYLTKPRGKDQSARRPIPEKGILVKELPRPPQPLPGEIAPEVARSAQPPVEQAAPVESAAVEQEPPAVEKAAVEPPSAPLAAAPEKESVQLVPTSAQPSPVEPPPQALFPKAESSPPAAAGRKTASVDVSAKKKPDREETASPGVKPPAPPAGKPMYAVQVGCFKEKSNAEQIRRNLQARGYEVLLLPPVSPKARLYVVRTKPVASLGTASTQLEQIKNEQKVNPMIVTINPGSGGDGKQPQ